MAEAKRPAMLRLIDTAHVDDLKMSERFRK
jgi:hypothetical protein